MEHWKKNLSLLSLLAILACGGGGGGGSTAPPPPKASQIIYQDPSDTSKWRFTRNAGSSAGNLILDLRGPSGDQGRGVAMVVGPLPPGLLWSAFQNGQYLSNGSFNGTLVQRGSISSGILRILLSQKTGPSVPLDQAPVLSIAVTLNPGAAPQTINLTATHCGSLTSTEAIESFVPSIGQIQLQ